MLLAIPLAIGLAWGAYLDDSTYATFHTARDLVAGRGMVERLVAESPLYVLALTLPAGLGIPLPLTGLVLGALGWGASAIAIYKVAQAMHRPTAAIVSASLLTFNPAIVWTLGTEIPWTIALAWIAIALSKQRRAQIGVLTLLLLNFPGLPARAGRFQTLAPALRSGPFGSAGVPNFKFPISNFQSPISSLLGESELYWLFLPFIGLGLFAIIRSRAAIREPRATSRYTLYAFLLLGAIWLLGGGTAVPAMLVTLGLFLAGLGIDWGIEWIRKSQVLDLEHLHLRCQVQVSGIPLVLIACLPLGLAQTSSLWQRYSFRPVVRQELERQAGDWLRTHSEPGATVLGTERVGYLADRPTLPWDGSNDDQAAMATLLGTLGEKAPDYCISFKSIAWDRLMRTGWFTNGYTPLRKFESPYDTASPLTIWSYGLRARDREERRSQNAHLPDGVEWVGYSYGPNRIQPGDAVHLTLFLQATYPLTRSLRTLVRVISPQDGVGWAQQDSFIPRSIPLDWWQPGQVIAERFSLTTTAEIPVGAYHLDISMLTQGAEGTLPIYLEGNPSPVERVSLGYVAVPWQGQPVNARQANANFDNQITLKMFEAPDSLSPGNGFDVTLYWEARQNPKQDYMVFVHLLDAKGQMVANHDGPPMNGRYATGGWLPGDIVPDVHHIELGPETPAGTYHLLVGLYSWPSLERLTVWDSQGTEQVNRVLTLQSILVR